MPELLRHLRNGFPVQDVIAIMLGDRLLDGLLAGGAGLVGGAVKLQLAVFTGVLGGKSVKREYPSYWCILPFIKL